MKVAISAGHGKYIRGASGSPVPPQLDEVDEARRVTQRTHDYLRQAGVDCEYWWDDISDDQSENLNRITSWHNQTAFGGGDHDYDVSIHFNAYDGKAHGVECLYVTQESLAADVSAAIATASGLYNRGAKYRSDLWVLNNCREKTILVEVAFCDHTGDSETYREHFEDICRALAEAISGKDIAAAPPDTEEPDEPDEPDEPQSNRPTIGYGDSGFNVAEVQKCLKCDVDGDFGRQTQSAVEEFQKREHLDVDGVVGPQTWSALEQVYELPPWPPALPPPLDDAMISEICDVAMNSAIATYSWADRGVAPPGYIKGMAVGYSTVLRKYLGSDPAAIEMAKANTWNAETDVFAWYEDEFHSLGWGDHNEPGIDNLRHLFCVLLGLGMRESSGQHCCGRDMSAENVSSDTAEAGLHQTSWNINTCSDAIPLIMAQYKAGTPLCMLHLWDDGVSCSESNWQCYGSGAGYDHQMLSKNCPQYHVEVTGVGLRNRRQHWGPINRDEVELLQEADEMFRAVQELIEIS